MVNPPIPGNVEQALRDNPDILELELAIAEAKYVQGLVTSILQTDPKSLINDRDFYIRAGLNANSAEEQYWLSIRGLLGTTDGSFHFPSQAVQDAHKLFLISQSLDANGRLLQHYSRISVQKRFIAGSVRELLPFLDVK